MFITSIGGFFEKVVYEFESVNAGKDKPTERKEFLALE